MYYGIVKPLLITLGKVASIRIEYGKLSNASKIMGKKAIPR